MLLCGFLFFFILPFPPLQLQARVSLSSHVNLIAPSVLMNTNTPAVVPALRYFLTQTITVW